MKSKLKLFNKAIFKSTIKLNSWVSILNIGLLFLFMIMPIMASGTNDYYASDSISNIKDIIKSGSTFIIILTIPVILGVLVTRFMQNKEQSINIHSMPVEKKQIYITNVLAGLILLVIPIILNILILMALLGGDFFTKYGKEISDWTYITFSLEFITYAITLMIGTLIGISLIQAILTYIFMLFPVGIYMLVQWTLKILCIGYVFNESSIQNSLAMKLSILPQIFMFVSSEMVTQNLKENLYMFYILSAIAIMIISYFIYKIRKVEKAGDVVAFKSLSPILKYGMTFCFMLFSGIMVDAIFYGSVTHMLVAYFVASMITYFLSEMMIKKSVRVINSYKGYIGYVVVMIILFSIIKLDIIGFEKYVPNLSDINKVEYDMHYDGNAKILLTNETSKEAARNIHKLILSEKIYVEDCSIGNVGNINITYELKNGRKISREYTISNTEKTQTDIQNFEKIIFDTYEYKKQVYEVFDRDVLKDVTKIGIDNGVNAVYINKKEDMLGLIEAIKKDTLAITYDQIKNTSEDGMKYELTEKIESVKPGTTICIQKYKEVTKEQYMDSVGIVEENAEKYELSTPIYYNNNFINTKRWLLENNYYPKV